MGRRGLEAAAVLLAALTAACSGLFQKRLPAVPDEYRCTAAGDDLRVGAAERDITPAGTVWLGGFDPARASTGVAAPLKARAMVLMLGGERLALVGVDNLGLERQDVDWIKSGIAGFRNGNVFLAASHTHAGPDLIGLWGFYLLTSGRDRDYLTQVRAAVAAAVAEAAANAAPAELRLGTAGLPPRGLVKNANRPEVFDRRFTVLQARARDGGRPLGTLLHLACHPEVLSRRNDKLSSDFVGSLCEAWRAAGHGQAVFVNGALGAMVSPAWPQRDQAGADAMGAELVRLAEGALAAAVPLPVPDLEVRRRDVYLPVTTPAMRLARLTIVLPRDLYGGCARSGVGWLRLGTLEAVAVPGEMEPALAQRLRDRLGKPDLLVFGLVDDELGYLLREQEARDPEYAYERSMSPCLLAGELVALALAP